MSMKNVINNLMMDDSNGSWDEIESKEELKSTLEFYVDEYSYDEEAQSFYKEQLNLL